MFTINAFNNQTESVSKGRSVGRAGAVAQTSFTDGQPFPCSVRLASNYLVRRLFPCRPGHLIPGRGASLDSTLARRVSIYPPCRCVLWLPASSRRDRTKGAFPPRLWYSTSSKPPRGIAQCLHWLMLPIL